MCACARVHAREEESAAREGSGGKHVGEGTRRREGEEKQARAKRGSKKASARACACIVQLEGMRTAGGHVDQELTSLMDSLTLKTLSLVSGKCSASSKAQSTCASGTTSPAGPARRASGGASVRGAEIHTVQLQCSCTVREIASMNGVKLSCGARAQGPRHRTITGARFAGEANRVRGQASKRGGLT